MNGTAKRPCEAIFCEGLFDMPVLARQTGCRGGAGRQYDDRIHILWSWDGGDAPKEMMCRMSIASVLSREMHRSGITQKLLGEQAGVSQSYISQICSGKKVPTIGTLVQICACLGVPLKTFFEDERLPARDEPMRLTEDERRLVLFYRSIGPSARAAVDGGSRKARPMKQEYSPGRGRSARTNNEEEFT